MNAICGRLVGTLRCELLDRVLARGISQDNSHQESPERRVPVGADRFISGGGNGRPSAS
jgi:hypothetical protein